MASLKTASEMYDRQIKQAMEDVKIHDVELKEIQESKVSIERYKQDRERNREIMTNLHTVMDYYSNEFMRLENFLEKYLPLKVLNLISKALNNTIEHKYKWKLKDWED